MTSFVPPRGIHGANESLLNVTSYDIAVVYALEIILRHLFRLADRSQAIGGTHAALLLHMLYKPYRKPQTLRFHLPDDLDFPIK